MRGESRSKTSTWKKENECPNCDGDGFTVEDDGSFLGKQVECPRCKGRGYIGEPVTEYYRQQLENVRTCNCPAKTVGLMMGEVAEESWEANGQGKKVKGILAYSGISHNKRLYLPEVLSKGDGKTVPLIFNHATTAGIEQELPTLPIDIRRRIQNEERIQVGEVKLHWKNEDLTMFYEGVVTHPFFIHEIENDKMTVSLGMIFDANSPQVCDKECYTVVKGGEFNEVSLVYHPGFPIASIEANEAYLKEQIRKYGHTIYEGIEQEDMEGIWENMSDLQKITLVKIADLEEKYPNATTHQWNDFSGECVEQLVRAYNGEQSTVEPTNIADQNTNIVKDNELIMEYKNISNELDRMIDSRKTPTQRAVEAIDALIEAKEHDVNATQKVPDILGVYPLEDAIKDVTIIKWDNRNHVLPNRKTAILLQLKNRHPELTNIPERSHDSYKPSRSYSDDIKFDGETPFAKLPKVIKDDLKALGFEVRLDLPKSIAKATEDSFSDLRNADPKWYVRWTKNGSNFSRTLTDHAEAVKLADQNNGGVYWIDGHGIERQAYHARG